MEIDIRTLPMPNNMAVNFANLLELKRGWRNIIKWSEGEMRRLKRVLNAAEIPYESPNKYTVIIPDSALTPENKRTIITKINHDFKKFTQAHGIITDGRPVFEYRKSSK